MEKQFGLDSNADFPGEVVSLSLIGLVDWWDLASFPLGQERVRAAACCLCLGGRALTHLGQLGRLSAWEQCIYTPPPFLFSSFLTLYLVGIKELRYIKREIMKKTDLSPHD